MTASRSQRILFVYSRDSSFVAIDRDILGARWDLRDWQQKRLPLNLLALARAVRESDLVFGWFASWHTFWPVTLAWIMGKPSVVVIGGVDTACLPDIGYGLQQRRVMRHVSRWVMRRASLLVTNSRFSLEEAQRTAGVEPGKVAVVHHGVPDRFGEPVGDARERLALTVGVVDERNLERKGLRPFVAAAARLPDVAFTLVGRWEDGAIEQLRRLAPPNVRLTGWVDDGTLDEWYRRAAVYVQPSRHEGFGMSVAEAMLAGCVPVVTRAGALPEVVGDAGIVTESADPDQIARAVGRALELGADARQRARERVLDTFPLRARAEGIQRAVERALGGMTRS